MVKLNSPEFNLWFEKSKIVDGNSKALVCYHGSDNKFSEFDFKNLGTSNGTSPANMKGFYFSDKDSAKTYGKYLYPAYLSIKRPLIINANGHDYSEFKHTINSKIDKINMDKYDGVIIQNYKDAGIHGEPIVSTQYVVFSKEQIKLVKNISLNRTNKRNNNMEIE